MKYTYLLFIQGSYKTKKTRYSINSNDARKNVFCTHNRGIRTYVRVHIHVAALETSHCDDITRTLLVKSVGQNVLLQYGQ